MKITELLQEDFEPYIVIEIFSERINCLALNEGQWRPSSFKDLWYRVDPENTSIRQQRHVHIAHKKHINASDMQVSWNRDMSRHDTHKFNSSFVGIEKAKDLARQILKLPGDSILEQKASSNTVAGLLLEMISDGPQLPVEALTLVLHDN